MYQKNKLMTIVGLMSGTSMDGINATVVKTDGINLTRCGINYIGKYSSKTVKYLNLAIKDPLTYISNKKKLTQLNSLVTFDHYNCVRTLLAKKRIMPDLIGFHGQTIYHNSEQKISVQIADGYLLSQLLNTDVVCDFRSNDIKNGGEGAPLAPIYHSLVMKQLNLEAPSCFINIGGVSNITFWDKTKLIGFDTGPGNGLIDGYMQKILNLPYDESGFLASRGTIDHEIVNFFLQSNYYLKSYPKSLDKNHFLNILELVIAKKISHEDSLATLTECTVQSILLSLEKLPLTPKIIVIMGGGINNKFLIHKLKSISKTSILLSSDLNISGEMIEAELIAYISARSIYNYPITFPETTGTKIAISGGNYYSYKKPSDLFE